MQHWLRKGIVATVGTVAAVATLATGGVVTASAAELTNPNSAIGYPSFQGAEDPIPPTGVTYNPSTSYLASVFAKDRKNGAGTDTHHDFWVDAMLKREGNAPSGTAKNDAGVYKYEGADNNTYMFSRGRAAFMKSHDPNVLGFGGDVAYWESINGKKGYSIALSEGGKALTLKEDGSKRKQTPSYWESVFSTSDSDISLTEVKYITNNNVLVTEIQLKGAAAKEVTLTADSPYVTSAEGDELTGTVKTLNNLSTLYPRFSGNGFKPDGGKLVSTIKVAAGSTVSTKLQLGLIATELPGSTKEYNALRDGDHKDPAAAYKAHVTEYNKWWADNIPFIETPEHNIDKTVFYRWWLSRFNFLDADMPGNTFQFPTAVEGALGYNNAIVLTTCMFINDLKYLRDPSYSYGPWVAAGETSKSKQYVDNPGDPANWSNSYTQYITDAAWESYKVHGGPTDIADAIGHYGSNDVNALIGSKNSSFNRNGNKLIDWDWASMTGNDADAVSFDEHPGEAMDRAESAWVWANARSAAEAFEAAGDSDGAKQMKDTADEIRKELLSELWNPDTKLIQHKWIGKNDGDFAKWKEANNFYPYAAEMMPTDGQYDEGLRLFADSDQYPIFPFFTANQADKKEMMKETGNAGSNNFAVINSTPLFRIYAAGLRKYNSSDKGYITADSFKKLLYWNAFAHYQGGDNRYPDQNEFWNTATDANGGEINYRSWIHHTQLGTTNWTMIEDVAGLRPRSDNKIELDPISIPDWNHFTVNNLSYHGKDMSIVWNHDGYYDDGGAPRGFSLYLSGKRVYTSDKLTHITYDPATGKASVSGDNGDTSAKIAGAEAVSVPQANAITYGPDSRVTDIFAKAGRNVDSSVKNSRTNIAAGEQVEATYFAKGRDAANAVNGNTINEPFWGTEGSPNAKDSLSVTFKQAQSVDDIRLYFYQTSSSATVKGYAEPSVYTLEYQDEQGKWNNIPDQARTPEFPQANYNRIQFPTVKAKAIRATFTHADGAKTGVKEIEAFNTGIKAPAATNQVPKVEAYVASSNSSGAQLAGTVKDDGLPNGELTTKWEMVSGPKDGKAHFADASAASTTVSFNVEGDYVLQLSASDGDKESATKLTVHGIPSDGTVNVAPQATPSASYINGYLPKDNVKVINDGKISYDGGSPNASWNNWGDPHTVKQPWIEYDWGGVVPLRKASLHLWSDNGGVPMAKAWKLQYWDDSAASWKYVQLKDGSAYTTKAGGENTVQFNDVVKTSKLRAVFPDNSVVGVSELEAYAEDPVSVDSVDVPTTVGVLPKLPSTVNAAYSDGHRADLAVKWDSVSESQVAQEGEISVRGTVVGSSKTLSAKVWVRSDMTSNFVNKTAESEQTVVRGAKLINLPSTVTGIYNNGVYKSGISVEWDDVDVQAIDLDKVGDYTVNGIASGEKVNQGTTAKLIVHVIKGNGGDDATPTVDKSALEKAVNSAKQLTDSDYTPASWTALSESVKAAEEVLKDDSATQQQVDDAAEDVTTKMDSLVRRADKTSLNQLIDAAKALKEVDYTPATWSAVQDALAAAEAVAHDGNATEDSVKDSASALDAALKQLVKNPIAPESIVIVAEGIQNGKLEIKQGTSSQLNAKILPEGATGVDVAWSSSDPNVLSVDSKGRITANSVGTATVTAAILDEDSTRGKGTELSASLEVKVVKADAAVPGDNPGTDGEHKKDADSSVKPEGGVNQALARTGSAVAIIAVAASVLLFAGVSLLQSKKKRQ
jgi:beta-L-arabinobiosidase